MSKDQAIGGAILAVCIIVAIGYAVIVIIPVPVNNLLGTPIKSDVATQSEYTQFWYPCS